MNKGVEILLARMRSNPQEFDPDDPKWGALMSPLMAYLRGDTPTNPYPFMTPEEMRDLQEEFLRTQGEWFTRRVMDRLLTGDGDLANQLKLALTR